MPTFQYTAFDAGGRRVGGALAAPSEQAMLSELESRRLTPVSITPEPERGGWRRRGVGVRALAESYHQMSDLLRAGVPLVRALRLLGARKAVPRLSAAYRALADAVAEGQELADAMNANPSIFGPVHVAMVRAGEKGGFLESVFARLGQFLSTQAELRSKVIGSMIYPAILVVVGVIVLGVVFGIFVPMFEPMFERIRDRLPLISRAVFGMSALVTTYGLFVLVIVGAAGFALHRAWRRPSVRLWAARARTRAPVIGPLVRGLAAARFCRMLGTLLGNGIPVLAAMQIARDAAGNPLMAQAIDRAADAVRAGQPLAPPLAESGLFGEDVVEMIAVGEAANNLDDVLLNIADTIERRTDRLLTNAVKLIEPAMLLAIAMTVGLVAAALILPMTQLSAGL